jgi:hypothetical protein
VRGDLGRITSNIGTNTIPIPKPVIASGPASSQAFTLALVDRMTRSTTTRPIAIVTIPMCIVVLPIRASNSDDVIEPPIAATGIDTVATPQASGLKPRPAWNITLRAIIMPPIAPMKPSTTARPAT